MDGIRKKIRTIIVDDEPLARQNIEILLKDDLDIEIVGRCASGMEALEMITEKRPDLMFLDIQMPEMSGFELLARLPRECLPVIVFVTAYNQYALEAFEVHAIDYLLKPFNDERFDKALKQAKLQIENAEISKLSQKLFALIGQNEMRLSNKEEKFEYLKRIMVKTSGRIIFLDVADIDWIGADDYYVRLHTGKKSHLVRETMNDLEARLDPQMFIRIHRSTIVNINRIKELQPHFNGDLLVVLADGTGHRLSRSRRERVQLILTGGKTS